MICSTRPSLLLKYWYKVFFEILRCEQISSIEVLLKPYFKNNSEIFSNSSSLVRLNSLSVMIKLNLHMKTFWIYIVSMGRKSTNIVPKRDCNVVKILWNIINRKTFYFLPFTFYLFPFYLLPLYYDWSSDDTEDFRCCRYLRSDFRLCKSEEERGELCGLLSFS